MKLLNQFERCDYVERTFDKKFRLARICTTETPTLWLVTIKIIGYSLPSCLDWRVSKKTAKTREQAEEIVIKQAIENKNI